MRTSNRRNNRVARREYRGLGRSLAWLASGLGAVLGVGATRADVEFTPSIGVAITWTDNIDLESESADRDSATLADVSPGFTLTQRSERINTNIDYTLRGIFYADDSDRNTYWHDGTAGLDVELIADWFSIAAAGGYTQVLIDPKQVTINDRIFDEENVSDTVTGSVMPQLLHRFSWGTVQASYYYGFVDYLDTAADGGPLDDNENDGGNFSISSPRRSTITWALRYQQWQTDYDVSQDIDYRSADGELGYRVTANLELFGSIGKESDLESEVVTPNEEPAGLDEKFWRAGFRWRPSARDSLELSYGHRFFGNTFDGAWRREGRLLVFDVSYSEQPTTEGQSLVRPSGVEEGAGPQQQPPQPQPEPPEFTDLDFGITTDVYIDKVGEARVTLNGRRTMLTLGFITNEREYLTATEFNESSDGIDFGAMRQISARDQLEFAVTYTRTDFRLDTEFEEYSGTLGWRRQLAQSVDLAVDLNHEKRAESGLGYTVSWFTVGVLKTF